VCVPQSTVIIVKGGDVVGTGNIEMPASLFVPDGNVRLLGTGTFTGTLYADSLELAGNSHISMDQCFVSNLSPRLFDVKTSNYQEIDP